VDEAASIKVLCVDKTGTLTRNELKVTAKHPMAGFDEPHVLGLAALATLGWRAGSRGCGHRCSNPEYSEFNNKVVARIPGGEWAEPEDLAGAAIFLASPASKLINGVTIPVDGGYSAS
jgi:NAD(P)-dependent dehydrogenase (short-subunit alcohol dehydrogenase family)